MGILREPTQDLRVCFGETHVGGMGGGGVGKGGGRRKRE